uniref:Uncharacterized protein n=1 Tax=Panagrolaimus davidi TaxID=227884 RepID=A0A914PXX9_9BILA
MASSKAVLCLLFAAILNAALASGSFNPWGGSWGGHEWGAAPYYGYANSHGDGYGAGHDDHGVYDQGYGHKYGHDDAHDGGSATGFAKGAKSDWANYQYGGEGARAEGDSYAKGYGTAFGDGHDVGHVGGGHHGHDDVHGHGYGHSNGWGYAPHHFGGHGHGHGYAAANPW